MTPPNSETRSDPRRSDRTRELGGVTATSGARVTHYPRDHVDRTQGREAKGSTQQITQVQTIGKTR